MEANILNPLDSMSSTPVDSTKSKDLGKEEFLKLLSIQLQYQDPLDPMDNSEFIAQLAQFSSLEGITNMSDSLDSMSKHILSMNNLNAASLIGKSVKVPGNDLKVGPEGSSPLEYVLDKDAAKVDITIFDSAGVLVNEYSVGSAKAGANNFNWDGTNAQGDPAPQGDYIFEVAAANTAGKAVNVTTMTRSKVDGVVYDGDTPYVMAGGNKVGISGLQEIWGL